MADTNDNHSTNGQTNNAAKSVGLDRPFTADEQRRWDEIGRIVHNVISSRDQLFNQFLNPGYNIDEQCGYPPTNMAVPVELMRRLYDREPVANRVCQVMPKECWQKSPLVFENEDGDAPTDFEEAWDNLSKTLSDTGKSWYQDEEGSPIWEMLQRADIMSGIGTFGIILLGVDDGRNLQEPIFDAVTLATNGQGDSYLTIPEEEALKNGKAVERPCFNVDGSNKPRIDTTKGIPLNKEELATLELWRNQRQFVQNIAKAQEEANANGLTINAVHVKDWKGKSLRSNGMTLNAAKSGFKTTGSFGKIWGSGYAPPYGSYTEKADVQYNDGNSNSIGMMPGNIAGTDQQYFGVQFGPSEQVSDTPAKKDLNLIFLRTFDETLVQVVRYEWSVFNPRFGQPVMYRVTLNDPRETHSGIGLPLATVFVHWSRVIHIADNRHSSQIFGRPRMEPVINPVLDIRKIRAAAAEGYWKSCFTGLSLETIPQLGGDVKINRIGLEGMVNDFQQGLQRALFLAGMNAKTIAPSVVDPTPHINTQIAAICVQLGMPVPVFNGYEIGEQASENNDEKWNDRVRNRENLYLTPLLICPFIDRLIQIGVLPEPKGYSVEWPDLDNVDETTQSQVTLTRTQALTNFVSQSGENAITLRDYFIHFMNMDEELADAIIEATQEAHENEETMTTPPMVAGRPAPPAEGTQEAEQEKNQQLQQKQQLGLQKQALQIQGNGPPPKPGASSGIVQQKVTGNKWTVNAGHDVSDEPRGKGGKWTKGGDSVIPPLKGSLASDGWKNVQGIPVKIKDGEIVAGPKQFARGLLAPPMSDKEKDADLHSAVSYLASVHSEKKNESDEQFTEKMKEKVEGVEKEKNAEAVVETTEKGLDYLEKSSALEEGPYSYLAGKVREYAEKAIPVMKHLEEKWKKADAEKLGEGQHAIVTAAVKVGIWWARGKVAEIASEHISNIMGIGEEIEKGAEHSEGGSSAASLGLVGIGSVAAKLGMPTLTKGIAAAVYLVPFADAFITHVTASIVSKGEDVILGKQNKEKVKKVADYVASKSHYVIEKVKVGLRTAVYDLAHPQHGIVTPEERMKREKFIHNNDIPPLVFNDEGDDSVMNRVALEHTIEMITTMITTLFSPEQLKSMIEDGTLAAAKQKA